MHQTFGDAIWMSGDWRKSGPVYQIPLRCISGAHTEQPVGLPSRLLSTTDARGIGRAPFQPAPVTGEAAGAAAALSARLNARPSGFEDWPFAGPFAVAGRVAVGCVMLGKGQS